jgi:hypothetical protein
MQQRISLSNRHIDQLVRRHARQVIAVSLAGFALAAIGTAVSAQGMKAAPKETTQASPAAAAFTKADANKDGKLSKEEAAKLPAIAERFAALDKDADGFLSPDEFAVGYEAKG